MKKECKVFKVGDYVQRVNCELIGKIIEVTNSGYILDEIGRTGEDADFKHYKLKGKFGVDYCYPICLKLTLNNLKN